MTDSNDPMRAAHEAEQREAENEMLTEKERNDWKWDWQQRDLEADLTFNHTRSGVNLASAAYWHGKGTFWNALGGLFWFLTVALGLPASVMLCTYVIRYVF